MEVCEKSKDLQQIGKKVIRDHQDLRWIAKTRTRVGYAYSDSQKKRTPDQLVFGECRKVPAFCQAFMPYDFIIVFYSPNTILLPPSALETLMYHELLHIGLKPSGELYLRPHDIEEFDAIIDQYGLRWLEGAIGGGEAGAT
jgi:predicted metallopeptidase